MNLNSLRNALREVPFRPFAVCLADGRRVRVQHPEFAAINQRIVIVTDHDSATNIIEPLLIVSLEPELEKRKPSNGSHKKKPENRNLQMPLQDVAGRS
jgi:hypothetical protein